MRVGDGAREAHEVAGDEDVGKRTHERAEGAVAPRWGRELLGAYLVRPPRDRDRADLSEVRLVRPYEPFAWPFPGVYDFRYRLREPIFSFDFIWIMMRLSSSEIQISASPPSEKMPRDLMIG